MEADGGACPGWCTNVYPEVTVTINVGPFLTYLSVGMLNDLPPRSVAFEVL
jgi:hypothetical protein